MKNKIENNLSYKTSEIEPSPLQRRIVKAAGSIALMALLVTSGVSIGENFAKPETKITEEFKIIDDHTIEIFDGSMVEFSKDTEKYIVKEGDGMDAILYKIDGIGSIHHNDFNAVASYVEALPANHDIFQNNRIIEKGDGVTIPESLTVTPSKHPYK